MVHRLDVAFEPRIVRAGHGRILIVDDHADAREAPGELLRTWGHEVHVAVNGTEGIALALEQHPDVVLLDIGLRTMRWRRRQRRRRSRPSYAAASRSRRPRQSRTAL